MVIAGYKYSRHMVIEPLDLTRIQNPVSYILERISLTFIYTGLYTKSFAIGFSIFAETFIKKTIQL